MDDDKKKAGWPHASGCATRVQTRHSRVRRVRYLLGYEGLTEKLRCTRGYMACMACDRRLRTLYRYVHQSSGVRHYEGLKMNCASAGLTNNLRVRTAWGARKAASDTTLQDMVRDKSSPNEVVRQDRLLIISNRRTIQFGEKHQDQNHRYHGRTRGRTRSP